MAGTNAAAGEAANEGARSDVTLDTARQRLRELSHRLETAFDRHAAEHQRLERLRALLRGGER
jgi:hypothetical protein